MGRQSALSSDLVVNYDPLSGSNSWSVITFQGANGGGGNTENRIYDNSYEYRVNVGPVRLAAEVQARTAATAAPAMPSKATSGSTTWASRWISSAARSMTPSAPRLLALGVGVNPAVAIGNGQLAVDGLRQHRIPGRCPLHDRPLEVLRRLREHPLRQPEQSAVCRVRSSRAASSLSRSTTPTSSTTRSCRRRGSACGMRSPRRSTSPVPTTTSGRTATAARLMLLRLLGVVAGCTELASRQVRRHPGCSVAGRRLALRPSRRRLRRCDVVAGQWRPRQQLHRRPARARRCSPLEATGLPTSIPALVSATSSKLDQIRSLSSCGGAEFPLPPFRLLPSRLKCCLLSCRLQGRRFNLTGAPFTAVTTVCEPFRSARPSPQE